MEITNLGECFFLVPGLHWFHYTKLSGSRNQMFLSLDFCDVGKCRAWKHFVKMRNIMSRFVAVMLSGFWKLHCGEGCKNQRISLRLYKTKISWQQQPQGRHNCSLTSMSCVNILQIFQINQIRDQHQSSCSARGIHYQVRGWWGQWAGTRNLLFHQ